MRKDQIYFIKKLLNNYTIGGPLLNKIINLDNDVIDILNKNIDNKNLTSAMILATNEELQKKDNYLSLINTVLLSDKTIQTTNAVRFITNKKLANIDNRIELFLFDMIEKAEFPFQSKYACDYLVRDEISNDKDMYIVLNKILNAKAEFQASSIYLLATSQELTKLDEKNPGIRKVFIDRIADATKEYQAKYATFLVRTRFSKPNEELLKLVDKILNAKAEFQAQYAYYTAINSNTIHSKDYFEVVDKLFNTKSEVQAEQIFNLAVNKSFIDRKEYLSSMEDILKLETPKEIYKYYKKLSKILKVYEHDQYDSVNSVGELVNYGFNKSNTDFIIYGLEKVTDEDIKTDTKLNLRVRK